MTDGDAKNTNEMKKLTEVSGDQVYNWLTRYLLHQDQLSWSRTQTIVAAEAGLLASAFYLNGRSSAVPLLLGSAIVWLLWSLIRRDWQIRDQDLAKLDDVHNEYGIRIATESWRRGSKTARMLVSGILTINLVLAALFILYGSKDFFNW